MDSVPIHSAVLVIAMMAVLVYLTRIGGYLVGQRIRHIGALRPVLEALPGCAIIAIVVPALYRGSMIDALALACVVLIMWFSNSVALATMIGLGVLLVGGG